MGVNHRASRRDTPRLPAGAGRAEGFHGQAWFDRQAAGGRRAKWVVVAFWLIIVALAGPLAGKLTSAEKNDAQNWLPASAESTQVLQQQVKAQSADIISAVVVYDRPSGIIAADRAKRRRTHRSSPRYPAWSTRRSPGRRPPGTGRRCGPSSRSIRARTAGTRRPGSGSLRAIAHDGSDGLSVHVTGPLGIAADSSDAFAGIDSTLLYAALAVVIVLLLLTYRSPVLWLLPVASVGLALIAAQALIYLLARHAGLTVNAMSAGILSVLVFGAGTDYALLLTPGTGRSCRRHADRHQAMAVALRRAGPAIIASAATVALALLALMVAELNSTSGMGPVLAIGVVVALAAMLTLLPALLVITGRWVFWPRRPVFGSAEPTSSGLWARAGRAIAVRPRLTWIGSTLVLGAMALGIFSLNATGLSNAESFRGSRSPWSVNKPWHVTSRPVLDSRSSSWAMLQRASGLRLCSGACPGSPV